MTTQTSTQQITLHYRQGSSDKVYQVAIDPSGSGFVVNFSFGRRGSSLQTGTKTPTPVDYAAASKIFERLVKEKTAKGYTVGEAGTPYQHTPNQQRVSGLLPQLLNSIDEGEADHLIADDAWWAQEKFDGKRILIRKSGDTVEGINRKGLIVPLSKCIVDAVRGMLAAQSCVLDGEDVGDVYIVFDALERDGQDLRSMPYVQRYAAAVDLADGCIDNFVRYAPVATEPKAKRAMLAQLRDSRREGIIFKRHDAPYATGRPARGGPQLKLKFVSSCSCIVAGANGSRRSVRLELLDFSGRRVGVGNVTIPANHDIPCAGQIVEVQYLYAYVGGALYQPVYRGRRDDLRQVDCVISQLKFKPQAQGDGEEN